MTRHRRAVRMTPERCSRSAEPRCVWAPPISVEGARGREELMAGELNGAVVRRAIDEIWNQGVLETADALFAPAYINHGGLIPDLVRGPEAIKVGVALYRTAFPDFHVAV